MRRRSFLGGIAATTLMGLPGYAWQKDASAGTESGSVAQLPRVASPGVLPTVSAAASHRR